MPKRQLSRSRSRSRSRSTKRRSIPLTLYEIANRRAPANRAAANSARESPRSPRGPRLTIEELMLHYPQQINPRPAENVARLLGESMRRLTRDSSGPIGGSSKKYKRRSLKQKKTRK